MQGLHRRLGRVAAALPLIALALCACQNSQRFSEQPDREDVPMPQRQVPIYSAASAQVTDPNAAVRAVAMRYSPASAPADRDPLPGAYASLAPQARITGERIREQPLRPLTPTYGKADRILVEKAAHRMTLYQGDKVLAQFRVALGDPHGDKQYTGDRRTPEGEFTIDCRNDQSNYYRALCISYGHAIVIHGMPNGGSRPDIEAYHPGDWTDGCVALTDEEMDYLWRTVDLGTPITITA